ncbi:MAG: septum formation initiator family protein [Candidatus Eremiobacteraeota bacterium]|nr:septum formation initiator family protein [Candidatus Eremiobacteraeota bacterium]
MTARRGSLRFKVVRFARDPLPEDRPAARWRPLALWALVVAGRCTVTIAAALVAATIGTQVWRVAGENIRLHRQIVAVQGQNRLLRAQSAHLSEQVRLLHYPEYLVPLIHEQLGLAKPHEVFITVKPPPPTGRPR